MYSIGLIGYFNNRLEGTSNPVIDNFAVQATPLDNQLSSWVVQASVDMYNPSATIAQGKLSVR